MKCIFLSARSAAVLLDETAPYFLPAPVRLTLNGRDAGEADRTVYSLYGLSPDTAHTLTAQAEGGPVQEISFRTGKESYTLDVRRFGARGDGVHEDTAALQCAILCCPPGGRVLIPRGTYLTGPLFLKSHLTVEWEKGATLALLTDRDRFPILPGVTFPRADGDGDLLLGSWEGNPLDCYAAALNGIGVEDVRLLGEGVIDGRGQLGDWWVRPKERRGAWRGRLFYLRDCENVTVQGLTFRNSPSWNLHPTFSRHLAFYDIRVEAPAVSPNTDGFDPESCRDVKLYGAHFSVGDDCIAIKSGKIYMGKKYAVPCRDIEIAWCAMLEGHGGVTIGSEMAGGVQHVRVHHCLMRGNDRGLRVKTRRGRGKNAVVDDIRFEDVTMERVKAPLVVNCMYFCDPDGRSPFVQSREKQPVDDGTPTIGAVRFERVSARNCEACAAYILGLPENPVREIVIKDSFFTFLPGAKPMVPAMANGVEECRGRGVIAYFVSSLRLEGTRMEGLQGQELELHPGPDT